VSEHRLRVGWPPYLRTLTAGLEALGIAYEVERTAPDARTLVWSATAEQHAEWRALVLPSLARLRAGT
jgi:hypothetical protein